MLHLASRVYEYINDEDDYEIIKEWAADSIDEVYKCCGGIFQTEGHHDKLVLPISSSKTNFWNVFFSDSELMITRS